MRIIVLTFGMLISANAFAVFHHKAKVNPALMEVHKVYIKGNNEATVDLRRDMLKTADKYGDNACFAVVGNEKAADAILEVNEHEASGGLNPMIGLGGGAKMTTVATGTLSDSKGNLLWSDSKQGGAGMIHSGAGSAAQNLLRSLYHQACGSWNGDRK